jgi:hypothetical protein
MSTLDVVICAVLTLLCMVKFDTLARLCARAAVFLAKLCISFTISITILFIYKLQYADTGTWRLAREYISTFDRRRTEL